MPTIFGWSKTHMSHWFNTSAHTHISLFTVITRSEVVGVMAHPTASSPATVVPVHCIYHMFILYPYFMIYDYIGFMIYYIIST